MSPKVSRSRSRNSLVQETIDEISENDSPPSSPPAADLRLPRRASSLSLRSASSVSSRSSYTSLDMRFRSHAYGVPLASPSMRDMSNMLRMSSPDSLQTSSSSGSSSPRSRMSSPASCGPEGYALGQSTGSLFGSSSAEWGRWYELASEAMIAAEVEEVGTWLCGQLQALQCGDVPIEEARLWVAWAPRIVLVLRQQHMGNAAPLDGRSQLACEQLVGVIERSGFAFATLLAMGDAQGAMLLLENLAGHGAAAQGGLSATCRSLARGRVHDQTFLRMLEGLTHRLEQAPPVDAPAQIGLLSLLIDAWLDEVMASGNSLESARASSAWAVLGSLAQAFGASSPQAVVRQMASYLALQPNMLRHAQCAVDEGLSPAALGNRAPWELLLQAAALALALGEHDQGASQAQREELVNVCYLLLPAVAKDNKGRVVAAEVRALLTEGMLLHPPAAEANEPPGLAAQNALANAIERQVRTLLAWPDNLAGLGQSVRALLRPRAAPQGEEPADVAERAPLRALGASSPADCKRALIEVLCQVGDDPVRLLARASLLMRLLSTNQRFWPVDFAFLTCQGIARLLASAGLSMPIEWRHSLLLSTSARETALGAARGENREDVDHSRRGENSIVWPTGQQSQLRRAPLGGLRPTDLLMALGASPADSGQAAARSQQEVQSERLVPLQADAHGVQARLELDAWQAAWHDLASWAGATLGRMRVRARRNGLSLGMLGVCEEQPGQAPPLALFVAADREELPLIYGAWVRVQSACTLPACRDQPLPFELLALLALSPPVRAAASAVRWLHKGLLQAWIKAVVRSGLQVTKYGARAQATDSWQELEQLLTFERCLIDRPPHSAG